LIRKWNISRIDTDAAIHAFLFSLKADHPFETRNVFRIIAELVRSRHFSVGRYLQWLIATGSTNGNQGSPDDWPSHLRLIAEIPLDNLLDPVLNLRNTLLHGIGFTVETEEDQLNAGEDYVASQIPGLFESWSPSEAPEEMDVSELTCSIRLSLGCLLRQQVASKVQSTDQAASKTTLNDGTINISTLTAADVYSIRELVEKLGDFSILADILGMVVNSCELSILAAVADTLHYHYKTFVAIGAFKSLFQRLASRYALLRTERPPERELFLSLADLSRTAKADPQMLHLLRYDLGRCEPKNSLAACSPASDNMTDILQTTKMDTDDEINHILSSGTNMDEQIIARVFMKITSQLEEHVKKDQTRSNTFATWFYRLRSFDEKTFERLMNEYLMNLLTTHQGRILLATLPTLIAAGCTTLVGFAELSKLCIMSVNPVEGNSAAKMSLVALNALLPNEELNWFCQIPVGLSDRSHSSYLTLRQDAYRYRLCQQKFCADRPEEMLEHICRTIESCSSHVSTDLQAHFTSLLSSDRLLGVLRQLAVHEFHAFAVAFQFRSDAGSDHATSAVKTLLNSLLDPENSLGTFILQTIARKHANSLRL
jgi:mediator of RNA polymerase II transcription subunit 12